MKIAIIIPSFYLNDQLFIKKRLDVVGLTGPYLYSLLKDSFDTALIIERAEQYDFSQLDVDVAFISASHVNAYRAVEISTMLRKQGIITICGGYYPSFDATTDHAAKYFDSIVVGEVEPILIRLIYDITQGKIKDVYRSPNTFSMKYMAHPDFAPIQHIIHPNTFLPIQATRGCVRGCDFCTMHRVYGKTFKKRPIDDVFIEVCEYPKCNRFFVDDNIVLDVDYATELFGALEGRIGRYVIQADYSIASHPQLLKNMVRAGHPEVYVGFESISPHSLDSQKFTPGNKKAYAEAIKKMRDAGIIVDAGFMFGFDNDGPAVFEHTAKFLRQTKCPGFFGWIAYPVPGSRWHSGLSAEGRLDADAKFFTKNAEFGIKAFFDPKLMTKKELEFGLWHTFKEAYSFPSIFRSALSGNYAFSDRAYILLRGLMCKFAVSKRIHPMFG